MANFTVTTLNDELDSTDPSVLLAAPGDLSLREALVLANADSSTADTITFAANVTGGTNAGIDDGMVTLTSGELTLSSNVTIDGDVNGDDKADVTISGNSASRIFHATGGTSRLDALTISGGVVSVGDGGGLLIDSGADVTVANTTIQSNAAQRGGGIFVAGLLTVIDSTVALNSAASNGGGGGGGIGAGGGIEIAFGGTSVLVNATVAENLGQRGAGIYNDGGTLSVTNSTVAGNLANKGAGGIEAFSGSSTTLTNSIVAGNQNGGSGAEVVGVFTFAGLNVIGTGSDTDPSDHKIETPNPESLFAQVAVNSRGVTSGVLADNGGPVQTIAIKQGGVAHDPAGTIVPTDTADADGDANTSEPLPTDARGFARVDGAHVDVGAFELQAVNDAPTFAGLDGTPSYAENGLAVVLDAN